MQLEEELSSLWVDSDLLVKHAPTGHPLRNIAKFDVVVQEDCFPDQLDEAMEPKVRSFRYV